VPPDAAQPGAAIAASTTATPRWHSKALLAAGLAVVSMLVLSVVAAIPDRARGYGMLTFAHAVPPGSVLDGGAALSADSRFLAFVARDIGTGAAHIWVRSLDSLAARRLEGTEGATRPFWSPDGASIGFFAGAKLKTVRLDGAAPIVVADVGVRSAGGTWGASAILFAESRSGIYAVPTGGGAATEVTTPDRQAGESAHRWPVFLPDGRRFLYSVSSSEPSRAGLYLGDLASTTRIRVVPDVTSAVLFVEPDYLLYVRGSTLMAQRADLDRARILGSAVPIAGNVESPTLVNSASLSASRAGLLAFAGQPTRGRLVWLTREGQRLDEIEAPAVLHNPSLSPDQRRLLADSTDADRRGLWLFDLDRRAATRLVPDGVTPAWSPDGARFAFAGALSAGRGVYVRTVAGAPGDERLVASTRATTAVQDWSRDGGTILFASEDETRKWDLWRVSLEDHGQAVPYLRTNANEVQARISPDGTHVAYVSDESGVWEVYVQSFPTPGHTQTISVGGGTYPEWSADGSELFYLAPDRMLMAIGVDGRRSRPWRFARPTPLYRATVTGDGVVFRSPYTVSRDGRRFLMDVTEPGPHDAVTILVNWARAVRP
jgi:Tol biopolymer transport system component